MTTGLNPELNIDVPRVILGTDWWTDVDDAVAMMLVVWAHTQGLINLLGVTINTTLTNGAPSLDGFLKYYGIEEDLPIGVPLTSHVPTGTPPYQTTMKSRTAGLVDPDRVYPDSVSVNRQLLADALPGVEMHELGYLNNFQELMNSPADGISPLTGMELIAAKVSRLYIMGGDNPAGSSNNFNRTPQAIAAAHDVVANWPTEIVYNGHEIGTDIITGGNLQGLHASDILAQALLDHGSATGRNSWDPMSIFSMLARDFARGGFGSVRGSNSVDPGTGANVFTPNLTGRDCYLVKAQGNNWFKQRINPLLLAANWGSFDPFS